MSAASPTLAKAISEGGAGAADAQVGEEGQARAGAGGGAAYGGDHRLGQPGERPAIGL